MPISSRFGILFAMRQATTGQNDGIATTSSFLAGMDGTDEAILQITDALDQIIWMTDAEGHTQWFNRRWYEYTGLSFEETKGQDWQRVLHPDDLQPCLDAWMRSFATGEPFEQEYRFRNASGMYRWFMGRAAPILDPISGQTSHWLGSATDITERVQAERRLQRLFDSHVVGVIFWDLDTGLITDANDTFLSMVGYTREDLAAKLLDFRKMTPPEWTERNEQGVAAIRTEGSAVTYKKEYFRKDGSRIPILIGGTRFEESGNEGFSYVLDITEHKRTEERERARLTDIFMQAPAFMAALQGPNHIFEMVNPPYYQLVGHRDIIGKPAKEALPEMVEQGFITLLDQVYRTGEPYTGKDARLLFQVTPDSPLEERFVDFAYQPLRDEDGSVTGVLAHGVDLTERKRLEQQQEHLLAEERARAEREALINQIGDGIRLSLPPENIESNAVAALGQALGADRCYVFTADTARDSLIISRDWYSDGIPSVAGQYTLSELGIDVEAVFGSGETLVVPHLQGEERISEQNAETNQRFQVTSLINVPFFEKGRFVGALGVAMANSARDWSDQEVSLVETVAGQLRSVLEAARLQQRERNIAHQLQEALQPAVPTEVPGLELASYYRAALGEAEVGGDFLDAYPLSATRTALVVADLSGKGLDAASQVSLIRNQLRYALYIADLDTSGGLADVVSKLNSVLVKHELLTGFATLIVAVWDAAINTLTYVNCGQEPGLIWRASSGMVEKMYPTGPVLGGFVGGTFDEETVKLAPGDVIALFTDGMTEVGPNRKEFLEITGLAGMFGWGCGGETEGTTDPTATTNAKLVMNRLVSGVESHAGGVAGLRDDIALLVGVATRAVSIG